MVKLALILLFYYGGCQYVKGTKQILLAVCVVEFTGLHANLHFYTVSFTVCSVNVFTVFLYFLQNYSGNHSCQNYFVKTTEFFLQRAVAFLRETLHSLIKVLRSPTKNLILLSATLCSLRAKMYCVGYARESIKYAAFSHKCVLHRNVAFAHKNYCSPLIFAFAHKILAFSHKYSAFLSATLRSLTKAQIFFFNNLILFPSQRFCEQTQRFSGNAKACDSDGVLSICATLSDFAILPLKQ